MTTWTGNATESTEPTEPAVLGAREWAPTAGGWGAPQGPLYKWRWWALATVVLATVIDVIDALVTNVAGPPIQKDLNAGTDLVQWLGAGYTLALASGLIIGGRIGDIFGRRRVFIVGVAGFTLASVLCGVAQDPTALVVFRVLQGLFGAAMLPQGMGMIKEAFPPKEMPAAFGVMGPTLGIATISGPILAGFLISADLWGTGWRMIFLINVPLGVLAIAGAVAFLPRKQLSTAGRLDLVGTMLVAVSALLLVFPIVQGREEGWPAWTFIAMAAGCLGFVVFAWWERRVQARGGEPLIVPSLFAKRSFSGGMVVGLLLYTSVTGFSLIISAFLQIGLGYTAWHTGVTMVPQAIGSLIGFLAARAGLATKFGRKLIHVGILVMLSGVTVLGVLLATVEPDFSGFVLAPGLALFGAGMALAMAPFYTIVVAGVDPAEAGSAGGVITAVQQLGSAVGVAVMGTVWFAFVGDLASAGGPQSFIDDTRWTMPASAACLLVAGLIVFLMPRKAANSWG
ncbi:MFS transporter [Nocardia alba]|uniref:EmrB/QacA subfamily drug resistance transporter n=1 Tax=Nocardia alba TaxID=225051 RepID=A0A4R1F7J0_9NOCA|nr:MFS transporter [Nocardia alba]TCJ89903.1 EmrB/QacA subfamily drug resistance transporter [Nocardia alba]